MKNVDSKLLLGLIIGAAVGAAVGYLVATDKKDGLLEELNQVAAKVKDSLCSALGKGREEPGSADAPPAETVNE
jgi:hypothetical protein